MRTTKTKDHLQTTFDIKANIGPISKGSLIVHIKFKQEQKPQI